MFERLQELFIKFPGIGGRQAKRFVYFLLGQDDYFLQALLEEISVIEKNRARCSICARFFVGGKESSQCPICADRERDEKTVMIVEKDIDLENIERTGTYRGRYFVLGGTVPILDKNPAERVRLDALLKTATEEKPKEIIFALSATPEGDNTGEVVRKTLEKTQKEVGFSISILGRGLSTGAELEYSDAETIKNALENRR